MDAPWSLSLMKPEDALEVQLKWVHMKKEKHQSGPENEPHSHLIKTNAQVKGLNLPWKWFCSSFCDQAAAVSWSGPQEAAGGHRVLQQICRVPAFQSQTQLHLCLPAPYAGCQDEVWDSNTSHRHSSALCNTTAIRCTVLTTGLNRQGSRVKFTPIT